MLYLGEAQKAQYLAIMIETKPEAIELDYTIVYDGESHKVNYEITPLLELAFESTTIASICYFNSNAQFHKQSIQMDSLILQ